MMNKKIGIFCIGMMFSFYSMAIAATLKDEGRPLTVQVEIGKVTQVVFPQKVAKVVKGGDPDSVLVEVLDNAVYLLPKSQPPSDIFVTTEGGHSYPLSLRGGSSHDVKIQVGDVNGKRQASTSGYYTDVMDLMKDLFLKQEPAGAAVVLPETQVFLSNQQIEVTIERVYELLPWKAYVMTARNLGDNAVIIPIEQISLPNLLAISAEADMLYSKGQAGDQTQIYAVLGE